MKKVTKIYELTDGYICNTFLSLKDAKKELADMRNGYPAMKVMSQESREYWKMHADKMEIIKKTITSEKIV